MIYKKNTNTAYSLFLKKRNIVKVSKVIIELSDGVLKLVSKVFQEYFATTKKDVVISCQLVKEHNDFFHKSI